MPSSPASARLRVRITLAWLGATSACAHSTPMGPGTVERNGPLSAGPDVVLTLNPDQDQWPQWTADGRGILYAYVDQQTPLHRCVGLLPAAGGTRLWELCDNRGQREDTTSEFTGFDLDSTGRLLLAEVVAPAAGFLVPAPTGTLWLTDTARPYLRTALVQLPTMIDGTTVDWLAEVRWTSPTTFLALAQKFTSLQHCDYLDLVGGAARKCTTRDTVWAGAAGMVVQGTIRGAHATLAVVEGTSGAAGYALAEDGRTIVFATAFRPSLLRVPASGGTPVALVTASPGDGSQIVGVTCRAESCIFARDSIVLSDSNPTANFYFRNIDTLIGTMELDRVGVPDGALEVLERQPAPATYVTPVASPRNGDIVVQIGGGWGHLQTFADYGDVTEIVDVHNSVLHLRPGLLP